MKPIILLILTFVCLLSCRGKIENQQGKDFNNLQAESVENTDSIENTGTIQEIAPWEDEYIIRYLESNKNRLTEVDGHPVTYIKETSVRDNINYVMVNIGHMVEHRYLNDQWIFIDCLTKDIYEYDLPNDSLILWVDSVWIDKPGEVPPDGIYRFDIAFAEWQGNSMGEKVTVIIKGNSIKIIYEGDGQLTTSPGKTGERTIIYQGTIMKHKSGVWIIGLSPEDTQSDEVGGCTDGPLIIDFKNKKYWTC